MCIANAHPPGDAVASAHRPHPGREKKRLSVMQHLSCPAGRPPPPASRGLPPCRALPHRRCPTAAPHAGTAPAQQSPDEHALPPAAAPARSPAAALAPWRRQGMPAAGSLGSRTANVTACNLFPPPQVTGGQRNTDGQQTETTRGHVPRTLGSVSEEPAAR